MLNTYITQTIKENFQQLYPLWKFTIRRIKNNILDLSGRKTSDIVTNPIHSNIFAILMTARAQTKHRNTCKIDSAYMLASLLYFSK